MSWGDALSWPALAVGATCAFQMVHVALQILPPAARAHRKAHGRRSLAQVGLAAGASAVCTAGACAAYVCLLLAAGRVPAPPIAAPLATFATVAAWQAGERSLCRLKAMAGILRFFDPGTAPGRQITALETSLGCRLDWLFGRGAYADRNLLVAWLVLGVTAAIAAGDVGAIVTSSLRPAKTSSLSQLRPLPPSAADTPLPGTSPTLTSRCADTSEVRAEISAGLPPAVAKAIVAAWRHDGAALLGCPMTYPSRWGDIWITPLSAGKIRPAFLAVNVQGRAAVIHDDFSSLIWSLLEPGGGALVYPRVAWSAAAWQFVRFKDLTCRLGTRSWGQPGLAGAAAAVAVPSSVLAVAAELAEPYQALFTLRRDGGAFVASFYRAEAAEPVPVRGPAVITYGASHASGEGAGADDADPCSPATLALISRAATVR